MNLVGVGGPTLETRAVSEQPVYFKVQEQMMLSVRWPLVGLLVTGLVVVSTGCASNQVQTGDLYPEEHNFQISEEAEIEDEPEVREVLDVLYRYRNAMVSKDFASLNRLVSEEYYENAGTTHTTEDDYGYDDLDEVFELMAEYAEEVQYEVLVQDVVVEDHRAHIDYEFEYAYQYQLADQETWDAGVDVNRLELQRENDRWRIIGGM